MSGTYNLNPEDMTWDNGVGQVLFTGADSNGKTGLYGTNGVSSSLLEAGLQGSNNLNPET